MRQRLGVLLVLALLALPAAASVASAQGAPASPPAAQPAPSAENPPGSASPSTAAPITPPDAAAQTDSFNLTEALRGGQPMTSAEAAKRAVDTAPSLARVEANAQKAEAAAEQAFIAVYPKLDLEARYSRVSPVTIFNFDVPENQGMFQARLNWPVSPLFFSIIPRHDALVKLSEQQRVQTYVERQAIKLRAREAYYEYARSRATLMVAKAALAQSEAQRKDSEALVAAGSVARVELVRAEARVAASKVALSRAEFAVTTARSALLTMLHLDGNEDIAVTENLEEELPWIEQSESAVYKAALERRSELQALRLLAQAQEKSLAAARGQALPVVAIGGTAEVANPNQRFLVTPEWKTTWMVYASLIWTPTDTFSALRQADLAATQADLRALQDGLRVEVSQAYYGLATARATLSSARAGIAAAEESYRVRREQYRAGAAIAVDVLESENALIQARLDLVNALINQRIARARLDRAIEAE